MALFTVNVSHLRDNVFEHGCEAILLEIASHPRSKTL